MKKVWGGYFAGAAVLLTVCIIIVISARQAEGALARTALGAAAFAVSLIGAWWTAFYIGLDYRLDNKRIIIRKGIVFRKVITIPESAILAQTQISLRLTRKRSICLFTTICTAGSRIVIFAAFSTVC